MIMLPRRSVRHVENLIVDTKKSARPSYTHNSRSINHVGFPKSGSQGLGHLGFPKKRGSFFLMLDEQIMIGSILEPNLSKLTLGVMQDPEP